MNLAEKRAYADGVLAAGQAYMADLEHSGALEDAENLSQHEDVQVCMTCQMRRLGYEGFAARMEFAIDLALEDT